MRPKFLDDFTGDYRSSGEQRNYRRCPVCGGTSYKTYVDPVSGKWICFAGGCKATGHVRTGDGISSLRERLFKRERGVSEFSPIDLPETVPLPDGFRTKLMEQYNLLRPENYLLQLGVGDLGGRVVIPYADKRGDIVFWNARTMIGDSPKYLAAPGKKPLYRPQQVHRANVNYGRLYLVEGPFDAMSLHDRHWVDVVALGGTSLSEAQVPDLKRLATDGNSLHTIIILLDSAALGQAIALKHKLSGLLPQHDIRVRQLPAGVKDPAAASMSDLMGVLA